MSNVFQFDLNLLGCKCVLMENYLRDIAESSQRP